MDRHATGRPPGNGSGSFTGRQRNGRFARSAALPLEIDGILLPVSEVAHQLHAQRLRGVEREGSLCSCGGLHGLVSTV